MTPSAHGHSLYRSSIGQTTAVDSASASSLADAFFTGPRCRDALFRSAADE